jgi:hypothetical protein
MATRTHINRLGHSVPDIAALSFRGLERQFVQHQLHSLATAKFHFQRTVVFEAGLNLFSEEL